MKTWLSADSSFEDQYWKAIKISFAVIWAMQVLKMLNQPAQAPYPVGICRIYDFNFLFTLWGKYILVLFSALAITFYLKEKFMLAAIGCLSLISMLVISHHESNGVFLRATPLSTVWIAQFGAYLIKFFKTDYNLSYYRVQYPVQIIAATYTLAAISKLTEAGLNWPVDGSNYFSIQMLKGFSFNYFDTGDQEILQEGYRLAGFMLEHKFILKLLLCASLALETCCILVVFHPRLKFFYGIALTLMHIGIYFYMNILIAGLVYPMVIFFINPLYLLQQLKQKVDLNRRAKTSVA